ncbi:MAG: hypothetical protein DRP65_03765 [Planctomycetota bacterium]|nr:MAG: hypothetical protein DRP65_03765 [Planctomycetota bacterium]
MTSQNEFLNNIISALAKSKIPYMVSGSFGSSFHGRPRATNDVDIVIDLTLKQLEAFIETLGAGYYVNSDSARMALTKRTMFNVIDIEAGWKADLIIRKERPYSVEEFDRKRKFPIEGSDLWVVSPEDAILSKLEWSKGCQSQQQFQDALGVVAIQTGRLDLEYLHRWAKELGITDELKKLLNAAGRNKGTKQKN